METTDRSELYQTTPPADTDYAAHLVDPESISAAGLDSDGYAQTRVETLCGMTTYGPLQEGAEEPVSRDEFCGRCERVLEQRRERAESES